MFEEQVTSLRVCFKCYFHFCDLSNRKEYKVVLLNGKVSHLLPRSAQHNAAPAKAFSTPPHKSLFAFAELCVQVLKSTSKGHMLHGLCRADIMQTLDGNFTLNEFESFEANYGGSFAEESGVSTFLDDFWAHELSKCITICN